MKHIVCTSVLLVVATCVAMAQSDTATYKAREVVVSAAMGDIDIDKVPRTVEVLTADVIKQLPARSVQELLQWLPGVDVRQRGPGGVQADITLRGGGFEQTAVMIDGLRMNDVQTGHHNMNLPLLPQDIERIEIIKGGTSRLFGANALDGAVNIIPKRGAERGLNVQATLGDFRLRDIQAGLSFSADDIDHRLSLQAMATDGARAGADADVVSAAYSAHSTGSLGSIRAHVGILTRSFGARGFYTPNFPDAWERTHTQFAGIVYRLPAGESFDVTARFGYRRNEDEFRLKRDTPTFYQNIHQTDQFTGQLVSSYHSSVGRTSLVIDAGTDAIESTNLGNRNRVRGAVTLDQSVPLSDDLYVGFGGGMMMFSDRTPIPVGGVDVSYIIAPQSRLYGTLNRSARIPSYTDLYYSDPVTRGNAALRLEHALSAEGGVVYTTGAVQWNGAVYTRWATDMIDYALYTGDVFVAANIGNVDVTGMEAGMRWRVKDDVAWSPITYMRLSMNWQSVTNTAPVATRYVADVLRFQGIAEIRASIPHSPVLFNDITFMVRVLDRMGNLEERLLGTKAVRVVGDATLTMSAFAPALISFEVTNIWNTPYVEAGWVQMPGRWVRMRVGTTL